MDNFLERFAIALTVVVVALLIGFDFSYVLIRGHSFIGIWWTGIVAQSIAFGFGVHLIVRGMRSYDRGCAGAVDVFVGILVMGMPIFALYVITFLATR